MPKPIGEVGAVRRCHDGLTDRQRRFVAEYLVDFNARAASLRAGYKPSTSIVTNMMRTPHVRAAIDAAIEARNAETHIDAARVLAELGKVAFANMFDYVATGPDGAARLDLAAARRDAGAAIAGMTIHYAPLKPGETAGEGEQAISRVTLRLADKNAALREIARHLGIYRESLDVILSAKRADPEDNYTHRDVHTIIGIPNPGDPTGELGYMNRIPLELCTPEQRIHGVRVNADDPLTPCPHQIADVCAGRLVYNPDAAYAYDCWIPAPGTPERAAWDEERVWAADV